MYRSLAKPAPNNKMRLYLTLAGLATASSVAFEALSLTDTSTIAAATAALATTSAVAAQTLSSGRRAGLAGMGAAARAPPRSESVLRELFGDGVVDPAAVTAACTNDVRWLDMNVGTAAGQNCPAQSSHQTCCPPS